ncbi:MAG TPA: hypothetical protein DCK93_21930 [Blastocatellia bacterium]|nr:hypothetical protein [Blastocatellia bacterium]HAF25533.1 hypothetical protein [Blastocatellia bacterium]
MNGKLKFVELWPNMFAVIKRFLGGLFGRKQVEPPPTPPHDPYAYRTAPRKRGPYDRGGAVAVLEPDDDARSSQRSKVEEYL